MKRGITWKIRYKLFAISSIFMLPIGLLLYFMVAGINQDILFARKEIWGNAIAQPLQRLMLALPRHHLLASMQNDGDTRVRGELKATVTDIEGAFATLLAETARHGQTLHLDMPALARADMADLSPSQLATRWRALQSGTHQADVPEDDDHFALLATVRKLHDRVGDTSNLILDPDLDTYYLMDIMLLALPKALNRVHEILRDTQLVLTEGIPLTPDERVKFQIHALFLEDDLSRIERSTSIALREDGNFYELNPSLQEKLPPALQSYEQTVMHLANLLSQLSLQETPQLSFDKLRGTAETLIRAGNVLRTVAHTEMDHLLATRIGHYRQVRLLHLLTSLATIVIAFVALGWAIQGIARRLASAVAVTVTVADGDLTVEAPVDGKDEVGQLLTASRTMIDNLNKLVGQARQSGLQVSASATQLAASAREQETIMKHQDDSTRQAVASAEEISDVTATLTQTMHKVAGMSRETAATAQSGQDDLNRMKDAIHHMAHASETISTKLTTINEKADNITEVVTTITKVADQTNLLSLNAAIEAEKAGEYGRGFTVVAREIRRLADQTAVATLDIEDMVQQMQSAVSAGVAEMENFTAKVRFSVADVETVSTKLSGIIEQVQALSPSFEHVTQGMETQTQSAQQIKTAMLDLSGETEQIIASLHEAHLAIDQMNEAVHGMNSQLARFKVR